MARLFLSYSTKDSLFVKRLAESLTKLGHIVWFDEWEIRVGDSIVEQVQEGVDRADFVLVVLSKSSVASNWVEREWQMKYWDEVNTRSILVLPLLVEDCRIPGLLRPKRYADFRNDYETGLVQLSMSLQHRQHVSGIARYFGDFVDIVDDWHSLFAQTSRLDLLVMYGGTWRYTYLKEMYALLARPGGRLRAILPELEIHSPLLRVYAQRLQMDEREILGRVTTAISDLKQLASVGHVEIYAVPLYFYHACYLFETGGVLALYSYQPDRIPTPALVLNDGELLQFLRRDFEWLVSSANNARRILYSPS